MRKRRKMGVFFFALSRLRKLGETDFVPLRGEKNVKKTC